MRDGFDADSCIFNLLDDAYDRPYRVTELDALEETLEQVRSNRPKWLSKKRAEMCAAELEKRITECRRVAALETEYRQVVRKKFEAKLAELSKEEPRTHEVDLIAYMRAEPIPGWAGVSQSFGRSILDEMFLDALWRNYQIDHQKAVDLMLEALYENEPQTTPLKKGCEILLADVTRKGKKSNGVDDWLTPAQKIAYASELRDRVSNNGMPLPKRKRKDLK